MAKYTGNLNLKKPEGTDLIKIADFNSNFDILDTNVTELQSTLDSKITVITQAAYSALGTVPNSDNKLYLITTDSGKLLISFNGLQAELSSTVSSEPTDYIRITTSGATFSPKIELVSGSTATASWEVEGGSTYTGLNPTINFGSSATHYVRMKVVNANNENMLADVETFNIGFDNTQDSGKYSLASSYNYAVQSVTAMENVKAMTNLKRFLAAVSTLACGLDFTGMSKLEYIECYSAKVTSATLTGCTSLIRLCFEGNRLSGINLNPCAGSLYDLRASGNQSPFTFTPLTQPLAKLYHYCCHSMTVINHPTAEQLPAIEELWDGSSGQSGAFAPQSSALQSVISDHNDWTSVDFTNQFPTGRSGSVYLVGCKIASAVLTGCEGLAGLNLSENLLNEAAIDGILAAFVSFNAPAGTIDLSGNAAPSATGEASKATLVSSGWTVITAEPEATETILWSDDFERADVTGVANVGNGWYVLGSERDCNIVSGDLVLTGSNYNFLLNPAGGTLPTDYIVTYTLPAAAKGTNFGFVTRWANSSGVQLFFDNETTAMLGNAADYHNSPVSGFSLTYPTSWTNNSVEHTVAIKAQGTTITIYLDGELAGSATCDYNSGVLNTGVGFCGEGNDRHYKSIVVTSI